MIHLKMKDYIGNFGENKDLASKIRKEHILRCLGRSRFHNGLGFGFLLHDNGLCRSRIGRAFLHNLLNRTSLRITSFPIIVCKTFAQPYMLLPSL